MHFVKFGKPANSDLAEEQIRAATPPLPGFVRVQGWRATDTDPFQGEAVFVDPLSPENAARLQTLITNHNADALTVAQQAEVDARVQRVALRQQLRNAAASLEGVNISDYSLNQVKMLLGILLADEEGVIIVGGQARIRPLAQWFGDE